jgi:predicted TIM-barrel fold metal-dependent hydrolase
LPGLCVHTRRGFLRGLATTAAVAATPLAAQPSPRRIDVHHHVYPPKWFAAKRDLITSTSDLPPAFMLEWTPARAVEEMDKNGIAAGMASLANPGVWYGDIAESRTLARMANEGMADIARAHPGRFGVLAAIALPDIEGSLREIEYAYDTLKVDGVSLLTSYGDKWPGDPAFDPVFAELDRRKAVVFIHPTAPGCCGNLATGAPATILEYPFDEARAIGSLVFNGVTNKYKNIRFVFTHAGGPMPAMAARMDQLMRQPKIAAGNPDGIVASLRTLYFDVANSTHNASAMAALMAFADPARIVFGTDYPYVPMARTVQGLAQRGYSTPALAAIDRGNAAVLFPKFG